MPTLHPRSPLHGFTDDVPMVEILGECAVGPFHHPVPIPQALEDLQLRVGGDSRAHAAHLRLVVRVHHEDDLGQRLRLAPGLQPSALHGRLVIRQALLRAHRHRLDGHQQRFIVRLRGDADFRAHARQDARGPRVEGHGDGKRRHLRLRALVLDERLLGNLHHRTLEGFSIQGVQGHLRGLARLQVHHLVLAHLDLHLHGVQGGDDHHDVVGQVRATDALAHLTGQFDDVAVDGRDERRLRQVARRLLVDGGRLGQTLPGRRLLRIGRVPGRLRLLQLGARGQPLLHQALHARVLGMGALGFHLGDLDLGLGGALGRQRLLHRRLEPPAVDAPQHLPLLHRIPVLHQQLHEISGEAGGDLHGGGRLHLASPRDGPGDGPLVDLGQLDLHGRGRPIPEASRRDARRPEEQNASDDCLPPLHFNSPGLRVPMARIKPKRAVSTLTRFSSSVSSACVSLSCASRTSSVEPAPALKRSSASARLRAAVSRFSEASCAAEICVTRSWRVRCTSASSSRSVCARFSSEVRSVARAWFS
ncbi:hypothetical protein STIAU_6880 [Stigmatella aurantiaca DW4/3-1]|uniref:Uncharacterized protein n=1 Tax=Stigmatella aurantiaca (strain DW4/3-1) TaxID=378806 RepID=Q09AW8_STIAD|nr:hypothetical protein STIAU_6880 [Stigmatella aurantiaca DW4/3-1]